MWRRNQPLVILSLAGLDPVIKYIMVHFFILLVFFLLLLANLIKGILQAKTFSHLFQDFFFPICVILCSNIVHFTFTGCHVRHPVILSNVLFPFYQECYLECLYYPLCIFTHGHTTSSQSRSAFWVMCVTGFPP